MEQSIFEEIYSPATEPEKMALIEKLQAGDYHLSFSALTAFSVSPRNFINYKVAERKSTTAMMLGELLHCLVLEEDKTKERYHIAPDAPLNTSEGKNKWAEFVSDITGCTFEKNKAGNYVVPTKTELEKIVKLATCMQLVSGSVYEEARYRAKSLVNNKACRYVINQLSSTEVFLPDNFEVSGIKFKGKIDGIGDGVIADLKNMPDATMNKATQTVWSRKLHWQAWAYDRSFGGGHRCHVLAVDGMGETSAMCFHETHLSRAEKEIKKYLHWFKQAIFESITEGSGVWDMSQDFWAKSEMNPEGVLYL